MRREKDSLMAMLEAFVHDPLISWRLMPQQQAAQLSAPRSAAAGGRGAGNAGGGGQAAAHQHLEVAAFEAEHELRG